MNILMNISEFIHFIVDYFCFMSYNIHIMGYCCPKIGQTFSEV